jgi:uncharacterized protein (TIGR02421 family)
MSLTTADAPPRALPPVAARVDAELGALDARVDWLLALSPLDNDRMWDAFEASGRTQEPAYAYIDLELDLAAERRRLLELPIEDIESPVLSGLLAEKQRELDRQIELVRLRGTDGFLNASLDLFGGVEPSLHHLAETILADVPASAPLEADAGIDEVSTAIEAELDWYRGQCSDFQCDVVVDTDLSSMMMVSHGTLYVDGDIRLPHARVQPLVQHEVGTHVVTRHNGLRQPLRQLAVGLAHYDPLQEGLGVMAEYLAGCLPGARLRILAARVVAAEMAIQGEQVPAIFDTLHETHGLPTDDAFDVAVRARRGGGLTKDAVYLDGLRELVQYLADGGDFAPLFRGKFALTHLSVLDRLEDEGWVAPPALMPRYARAEGFDARLDRMRKVPVEHFFHAFPDPGLSAPGAPPQQEHTTR